MGVREGQSRWHWGKDLKEGKEGAGRLWKGLQAEGGPRARL